MSNPFKDFPEVFEDDVLENEITEMPAASHTVKNIIPGADLLIVLPDEESEADDKRETTWEDDSDHSKFIAYLERKLGMIPRHSGTTTVGCERAIAYLRKLDREISRAVQTDENNVIDEEAAEEIRDKISDFIDKLDSAYDKLQSKRTSRMKKKSSVRIGNTVVARIKDGQDIGYYIPCDFGDGEELLRVAVEEPTDGQVQTFAVGEDASMVKEATAKIYLFEDPFLHAITRLLINSHVSAGRDIEQSYEKLKEKYDFTPREELSIQELLRLKGFPVFKDMGRLGEDQDPSDGKGVDFSTVYQA
jgi:hypothetical protein